MSFPETFSILLRSNSGANIGELIAVAIDSRGIEKEDAGSIMIPSAVERVAVRSFA